MKSVSLALVKMPSSHTPMHPPVTDPGIDIGMKVLVRAGSPWLAA